MFKKIENLLNQTKENSQENKYKEIKEKYGKKIALLVLGMGDSDSHNFLESIPENSIERTKNP